MQIPARCDNCGLVFGSGIEVGIGSSVQVYESKSQCRRCGALAPITEGVMEVILRGIRLLDGPDATKEVFDLLKITVEDWRSGRVTVAQGAERIAKKHPGFAKEFRDWTQWGATMILLIIGVIAFVWDWRDRPSNQTVDEVVSEAASEFYRSDQPDQRFIGWPSMVDESKDPSTQGVRGDQHSQVHPQQENRKSRRANAARERKKRR